MIGLWLTCRSPKRRRLAVALSLNVPMQTGLSVRLEPARLPATGTIPVARRDAPGLTVFVRKRQRPTVALASTS